jgi:vitamin B12 transporter
MKNTYRGFIALAIHCFLITQVFAQSTGSLSGRITDSQGAAVAGASVTIYARATNLRATTVSGAQGEYRFERLLGGEYVIESTSTGFGRSSRTCRIERGASVTLDFTLEIAGVSETVLVTAAGTPQTVDEISKAVSVVTSEEIDRRDEYSLADALRTVPGLRVQQL